MRNVVACLHNSPDGFSVCIPGLFLISNLLNPEILSNPQKKVERENRTCLTPISCLNKKFIQFELLEYLGLQMKLKLLIYGLLFSVLFSCSDIEQSMQNDILLLKKEKQSHQYKSSLADIKTITESEMAHLPEPVQRYLRKSRAIDTKPIKSFTMYFEGDFKMNRDNQWMPVEAVSHADLDSMTRLFYMKLATYGITMIGKDEFKFGKGRMQGWLMEVIQLFDESGEEFDIGEQVTLLNDLTFAPSALLDKRISWTPVNKNRAKATLTAHGRSVSAEFIFNDEGEMVDFYTMDRFVQNSDNNSEIKYIRTEWSTPFSQYKETADYFLPSYGEAVWHPEGEESYSYARFHVKKIEYTYYDN